MQPRHAPPGDEQQEELRRYQRRGEGGDLRRQVEDAGARDRLAEDPEPADDEGELGRQRQRRRGPEGDADEARRDPEAGEIQKAAPQVERGGRFRPAPRQRLKSPITRGVSALVRLTSMAKSAVPPPSRSPSTNHVPGDNS